MTLSPAITDMAERIAELERENERLRHTLFETSKDNERLRARFALLKAAGGTQDALKALPLSWEQEPPLWSEPQLTEQR